MFQSHVSRADVKQSICEKGHFFKDAIILRQIQGLDPKVTASAITTSSDKKTAYLASDGNKIDVWDISVINQPKKTGGVVLTGTNLETHKIAVNNDYFFVINKHSERYKAATQSKDYCVYIYHIKNNYSFVKKLRIGNRVCPEKIISIDSYLIFDSEYYYGPEIHIVDLTDVNQPKYIERISIPGEYEEEWDLSPDLKFISEKGSTFESVFLNELYKSKMMITLLSCGGYKDLHVVKEVSSIIASYGLSHKRKPTFTYLDNVMLSTFEIMYSAEEREKHFESPPNIDYSSIYLTREILYIKKGFVNALADNRMYSIEAWTNSSPGLFLAYIDEHLDAVEIGNYIQLLGRLNFDNVEKYKSILKCNIPLEQEETALFERQTLFFLRQELIWCLNKYKDGEVIFSLVSGYNYKQDNTLWFMNPYHNGYTYPLSQENIEKADSILKGYLKKYLDNGFKTVSNIDVNLCEIKVTISPEKVEQLKLALNINPMSLNYSNFNCATIEDNKQFDLTQMKKDLIALDKPGSPIRKVILKKGLKCSQLWLEKRLETFSLSMRLAKHFQLKKVEKLNLFLNITKAIKWCHTEGVFYGNLSPYDIISCQPLQLSELAQNRYCLAKNPKNISRNWRFFNMDHPSEIAYCAPELFNQASLKESNASETGCVADEKTEIVPRYIPTEKTDVYGLGRLLYYIVHERHPWAVDILSAYGIRESVLSGKQPCPYQSFNSFNIDKYIASLSVPSTTGFFAKNEKSIDDEISKEFEILMVKCCDLKPENRLTLDNVITRLEGLVKKVEAMNVSAKQNAVSKLCCNIM
jgi:hypothetical protein